MKFLKNSWILLLISSGCIVSPQDFDVNSSEWASVNPELTSKVTAPAASPSDVIIAVLDTGIDYNHPRIAPHIRSFSTASESGRNYGLGYDVLGKDYFPFYQVLDSKTGKPIDEDSEWAEMVHEQLQHGTQVAQLACLDDDLRIVIFPVRVIPIAEGAGDDELNKKDPLGYEAEIKRRLIGSISTGIEMAAAHGASIVNMSLGMSLEKLRFEDREKIMQENVIPLAKKLSSQYKDILFIAAAGNESLYLKSPLQSIPATLEMDDLLAVGALSKNQKSLASFTNYGRYADVYMRGTEISTVIPDAFTAKEVKEAHLKFKSDGTSFAAPLVAHLAAQLKLILPAIKGPALRALILNTSDLKTMPVEGSLEKRTIRVVNSSRARKTARSIKKALVNNPSEASILLVSPFKHGHFNFPF